MKKILSLMMVSLVMIAFSSCSSSKSVTDNGDSKARKEQKLDSDKRNFENNSYKDVFSE